MCFEISAMRDRSAVFYLNERSIILESSPRFLEFVREERLSGCLVFEIVLTAMSADLPVVTLTAADIPGAHLCEPYDKHTVAALRWWLLCRGIKALTSWKKSKLIERLVPYM